MPLGNTMHLLSGAIVLAFGFFLVGLAMVIVIQPTIAERFLRSFASSARAHYTEQGLRLLVGTAVVTFAEAMWHPQLFRLFGWIILATTIGLLLIPWRWHHRFASRVMPPVFTYLRLFALGAFALGACVLYGVSRAVR